MQLLPIYQMTSCVCVGLKWVWPELSVNHWHWLYGTHLAMQMETFPAGLLSLRKRLPS